MDDYHSTELLSRRVATSVSALFVPGDRPERFNKAFQSGAHIVIIDLEDAVSAENKDEATTNVLLHLANNGDAGQLKAMVRVNKERMTTELPLLLELSTMPGNGLLGIMVPKVESESDIPRDLGRLAVIPLIESARGIENITSIARTEGLTRLGFGAVDFGSELESEHPTLLGYARSRVVIASAAAGLSRPLDSPSVEIKNQEALREECSDGYKLGFGGKMSIHPSQIETIHSSFAPTSAEIEWATTILQSTKAAVQIDGQMVDRPIYEKAAKIIKRAESQNHSQS